MAVCGVCARWLMVRESKMEVVEIDSVPHAERLIPRADVAHPAQVLTRGMLLERSGVIRDDGGDATAVRICSPCMKALQKENTVAPPKYSLANNLWVGDVPWELRRLTVPEQLLIAILYPRVFVFKMWPKKSEGTWNCYYYKFARLPFRLKTFTLLSLCQCQWPCCSTYSACRFEIHSHALACLSTAVLLSACFSVTKDQMETVILQHNYRVEREC